MLKIAIIGCGKIADSHASQIARISDCRIIAACDREFLMARQFSERFSVDRQFTDIAEMLREAQPDVVHITTPPQGHFALARQCLDFGVHVYVEKPFTIHAGEAEELISLAERKGRKITVGHDDQFSHAARRLRRAIQNGVLGAGPVHMESHYCYDLSEPGYAKALLGDQNHWVRRLPGGLLQNIISHGIARIAEWLCTDRPQVLAYGFVSPILRNLGENEIVDELRVIINEDNRVTAYFTFSSQMRPSLHGFRIFGSKNGLALDEDLQTVIHLRGQRLKSYAEKFLSPIRLGKQYFGNVAQNLMTFGRGDFHMKSGMKFLIESFYRSISEGTPIPIPYAEILRTSWIMEEIFAQLAKPNNITKMNPQPVNEL